MSTTPVLPTASFPPLSKSGIVAGMGPGQLALIGVALLVAMPGPLTGDPAALVRTLPLTVPLLVLAIGQWNGRSLLGRVSTAALFAVRRRTGQTRAVTDTTRAKVRGKIEIPGAVGERLKVLTLVGTRFPGTAVIWDKATGEATAVLQFSTRGWHLTSDATKIARTNAVDEMCRNLANLEGVVRIKTHARTVPASRETLRENAPSRVAGDDVDGELVEPGGAVGSVDLAAAEYTELLASPRLGDVLHRDMVLSITISREKVKGEIAGAGGGLTGLSEVLAHRVQAIAAALPTCGVRTQDATWLSEDQLRAAVRMGFDPDAVDLVTEHGGMLPEGAALTTVVEERFDLLATDSAVHRTYWIETWPRAEVTAGFLAPLIAAGQFAHVVTQLFIPVPLHEAERRLAKAEGSHASVQSINDRLGRPTSTTHQAEGRELAERREELSEGYGDVRFAGYVTLSAASEADLNSAYNYVIAHAQRMHLNPLRGQQYAAFCISQLPLGLGPRS